MKQYALLFLKPDAMAKRHVAHILELITREGFKVVYFKQVILDPDRLEKHYAHLPVTIRHRVIAWMQWRKSYMTIIEGDIAGLRALVGDTDPVKAQRGTIRYLFSSDSIRLAEKVGRAVENAVHCSSDLEAANAEIRLWLPEVEKKFRNRLTLSRKRR